MLQATTAQGWQHQQQPNMGMLYLRSTWSTLPVCMCLGVYVEGHPEPKPRRLIGPQVTIATKTRRGPSESSVSSCTTETFRHNQHWREMAVATCSQGGDGGLSLAGPRSSAGCCTRPAVSHSIAPAYPTGSFLATSPIPTFYSPSERHNAMLHE